MQKIFTLLFSVFVVTGCASTSTRVQGYVGQQLAASEVATVFSTIGGQYGNTVICSIDGQSTQRLGCANLVYLLPGVHVLDWKFGSTLAVGSGKISLRAEAGRIYQLNASPLGVVDGKMRGMAQIIPMSPGSKLTYRNVNPNRAPAGAELDDPVPYGAN